MNSLREPYIAVMVSKAVIAIVVLAKRGTSIKAKVLQLNF